MLPRVLVNGEDIYQDYVDGLFDITEEKTFDRVKLITNTFNLPVLLWDEYFNVNNTRSAFGGSISDLGTIVIYDEDGNKIWDGDIKRIIRNNDGYRGVIESTDKLYSFADQKIEYESSAWETGAEAIQNILDAQGYENYDQSALQRSINELTTAGCKLKVNFEGNSRTTLRNVLEKIGVYSNLYIYSEGGKLYIKHYSFPVRDNSFFTITTDDMRTLPECTEDIDGVYNEYSIDYYGSDGTPATDDNSNDIGSLSREAMGERAYPEMKSGAGNQIVYMDKDSAVYIGEGKIRRGHKGLSTSPAPLMHISFSVGDEFDDALSLDTMFKCTYDKEGMSDKSFELFRYSESRRDKSRTLTALELPS